MRCIGVLALADTPRRRALRSHSSIDQSVIGGCLTHFWTFKVRLSEGLRLEAPSGKGVLDMPLGPWWPPWVRPVLLENCRIHSIGFSKHQPGAVLTPAWPWLFSIQQQSLAFLGEVSLGPWWIQRRWGNWRPVTLTNLGHYHSAPPPLPKRASWVSAGIPQGWPRLCWGLS